MIMDLEISKVFLSLIATASGEACNELAAYSLFMSCCCYTCCIRKKFRKIFNIKVSLCIHNLINVVSLMSYFLLVTLYLLA